MCVCAHPGEQTPSACLPQAIRETSLETKVCIKYTKKESTENTILKASVLQPPHYPKGVSFCAINNNSEPPGCWINRCFRIGLTWRSSWSCCINPSLNVIVVGSFCGVNWKEAEERREGRDCWQEKQDKEKKSQVREMNTHTHLHTQR